jgi:hypothetical protein
VTDQLVREGDLIGYTPQQPVWGGQHEVTLQGADSAGTRFASSWTFFSNFPSGAVPTPYNYQGFYLTGATGYGFGGLAQVVLVAPPGGYGFATLCGYAQQYPLVYAGANARYFAAIPIPANLFAPGCIVSGYFVDATGARNFLAAGTPVSINTMPLALARASTARGPRPFRRVATPRPSPRPTQKAAPKATPPPVQ